MSHIGHSKDNGWSYDPRDDPESWDYKPGWRDEHDYGGLYANTENEKDKKIIKLKIALEDMLLLIDEHGNNIIKAHATKIAKAREELK